MPFSVCKLLTWVQLCALTRLTFLSLSHVLLLQTITMEQNKSLLLGFGAGALGMLALAHVWQPKSCRNKKVPKAVKLTYFNFRGPAEKVRLALTMCGVEFEDLRINFEMSIFSYLAPP